MIERLTPEAQQAVAELRRTLQAAQATLGRIDAGVTSADAPLQRNANQALLELQRAARALRLLADDLQRNPESLLRGKPVGPALDDGDWTMTPRPHPEAAAAVLAPSPPRGGEGWGEGACLLALLLAACSSVPPTRFHTLMPPLDARATAPAVNRAPWQLQHVNVPAQVDRPQFVLRSADGSLAVLEQERWIAPLADELGGALTDTLARRLGPASTSDAWQIAVDVQRFESVPGRLARLEAAWSVRRGAARRRCTAWPRSSSRRAPMQHRSPKPTGARCRRSARRSARQ